MKLPRSIRFWWQRRTRGWDDSDTWSLDGALQAWLVPRLIRFKEIDKNFTVRDEEFLQALDDMIGGFSLEPWDYDDETQMKIQKAYEQLAKHRGGLWW